MGQGVPDWYAEQLYCPNGSFFLYVRGYSLWLCSEVNGSLSPVSSYSTYLHGR